MIKYENHQSRLRALIDRECASISHQIKTARAAARRDRMGRFYDEERAIAAAAVEAVKKSNEGGGSYLRNMLKRNAQVKARFGGKLGAQQ